MVVAAVGNSWKLIPPLLAFFSPCAKPHLLILSESIFCRHRNENFPADMSRTQRVKKKEFAESRGLKKKLAGDSLSLSPLYVITTHSLI
jgi:hypothetical protein